MNWLIADKECLQQNLRPGSCTPEGGPEMLLLFAFIAVAEIVVLRWWNN